MNGTEQRKGWNNSSKWPFYVFLAIGAYFLWTEHQAHVIEYLPLALVVACIGMHFFMHGSHGGHGRHDGSKEHDVKSHTDKNHEVPNSETASSEAKDTGAKS